MRSWLAVVVVIAACLAACLAACGDNTALPADAAVDAPPDAETYPAFAPPIPQVVPGVGHVMASVRVVPVFFPGDPLRASVIDALTKLGASAAWSTLSAEYGFGALTVGTPVDMPADPGPMASDGDVQSLLGTSLDGTHPEWGPSDAASLLTTLFVFYYPSTTSFMAPFGLSCSAFGGYHSAMGGTKVILYAIMPRCGLGPFFPDDMSQLFTITTHEVFEAASDPFLDTNNTLNPGNGAWQLANHGGEIGDMCQMLHEDDYTPPDLGYMMQRIWSNRSAAAFHDPCIPIPPDEGPYVAAIPDRPDLIFVTGVGDSLGVKVPATGSRTIAVRLASEAPVPIWAVSALYFGGGASPVKLQLDRGDGNNGDVIHLTITPNAGTAAGTIVPYALLSTVDRRRVMWPGVISITP